MRHVLMMRACVRSRARSRVTGRLRHISSFGRVAFGSALFCSLRVRVCMPGNTHTRACGRHAALVELIRGTRFKSMLNPRRYIERSRRKTPIERPPIHPHIHPSNHPSTHTTPAPLYNSHICEHTHARHVRPALPALQSV